MCQVGLGDGGGQWASRRPGREGAVLLEKREDISANTIQLSLPLWGGCPLSKPSAKRDGEGFHAKKCPLSRLSAPAPPKGEPFDFLNVMAWGISARLRFLAGFRHGIRGA